MKLNFKRIKVRKSWDEIKMVTIKDIAREAGVSPSTVSRVLSGKAKISPETTKRVMEAIKNLDISQMQVRKVLL